MNIGATNTVTAVVGSLTVAQGTSITQLAAASTGLKLTGAASPTNANNLFEINDSGNTPIFTIKETGGIALDMQASTNVADTPLSITGKPSSTATQFLVNVPTSAGGSMKFLDFQVAGTSKASIDKDGNTLLAGTVAVTPGASGATALSIIGTNLAVTDIPLSITGKQDSTATQLLINVPGSADANMKFLDFQVAGTSKFSVNALGTVVQMEAHETTGSMTVTADSGETAFKVSGHVSTQASASLAVFDFDSDVGFAASAYPLEVKDTKSGAVKSLFSINQVGDLTLSGDILALAAGDAANVFATTTGL